VAVRLPINQIRVGHRVRKDLGDLKGLAQSIEAVGLLHPIVVATGGKLIAGERRLKACRMLGWDKAGNQKGKLGVSSMRRANRRS